MASTIQHRRGEKAKLPKLALAEIGLCVDTDEVFIGGENGNIALMTNESVTNVPADNVTFSDGETFQTKYDSGELVGPQGPQGEQGIPGDRGEPGAAGPAGAAGKSAYAYAQEGGYTGTESKFYSDLASITSSTGDIDCGTF